MTESIATKELKVYMNNYNINQFQLSQRAFIPQARLSEILNNRRRFSPETDVKLCKVFNLKDGHFLMLQQEHEIILAQKKYNDALSKIISL